MVALNSLPISNGFRSSQRLTITVAYAILEALVERSNREGRSISNLAAYLLESSLKPGAPQAPHATRFRA